jgi:dTDP-4-dehydrorhamnose reductase
MKSLNHQKGKLPMIPAANSQDHRVIYGRKLILGGSGVLGTLLQKLITNAVAPSSREVDITDPSSLARALEHHQPEMIVNLAAYTDVAGAEHDHDRCWKVNVNGAQNIITALRNSKTPLVHISTDYVFDGRKGNYREDDVPGPTRNYYALTKLVAEQIVELHAHQLTIRTSFRPGQWPHPVAFQDLYTSQDYVDLIAPDIALAIERFHEIPHRILHIATERKSSFDLAKRRRPDVRGGFRRDAPVELPEDISLDVTRWINLKHSFMALGAKK